MATTRMRTRWALQSLLACLVLVGATISAQSESTTEIGYDDGTAETGRAVSEAGTGFAVRFTPAEPGDTLLRVSFYVTGLRGNPAPVEVHVWNEGREDLLAPIPATPSAEGWFDVDVSAAGLALTADVYVGYLQTSGDNHPWLGVDTTTMSDRSYNVPLWTPLLPEGVCAMIRLLTQHALASEDGLELAYDDGSAEAGRGYAMAGAGYAVRFTPPPGGALLARALIYVTGFPSSPAPIEVHVWDAEGRDLIVPFNALPAEEGWFTIDLSAFQLRMSSDFSVGYLQTDAENYPWLGVDIGHPNDRSYSVPDWNLLLPSGANAMIRVSFADEK